MSNLSFTLEYLKAKYPSQYKNTTRVSKIFPCPQCGETSCQFMVNTSFTMRCNVCGVIGNIFDVMTKKENMAANDVVSEVETLLGKQVIHEDYTNILLAEYAKNGFDMTPISPFEKIPIEKDWPRIEHKDMNEWKRWLQDRFNLGVKTGARSNITVVDIDTQEIPESIKPLLGNGLMQKTTNGYHYFYKYEAEIPTTRLDDMKIDLLNDGKQCVIEPSITDGYRRRFTGEFTIPVMPRELKEFLKSKVGVPIKTISERLQQNDNLLDSIPKDMIQIQEGNRHNLFMHLGGVYRKELNSQQTAYVLDILNRYFCKPSLSKKEMQDVVYSLEKYIQFDEKEVAHKILNYLQIVEESIAKDVKDALGLSKIVVDKCLSFLLKEGYVLRRGTRYRIIKKASWKDNFPKIDNAIEFELPYFHDIANTNWGDMILLGSKAKYGKTTIAMNILKKIVKQSIKPYYISLETGSRFIKTAESLGMREGDFFWDFQASPTNIELEPNAVTIIDWLMIEDKSETDSIMKHFTEQLYKTNGILIVFMQLKTDGSWFAPNMVHQFPALSARYLYDTDDGSSGKWLLDVIREAKIKTKTGSIPCVYDWDTKELRRVE